MPQPVVNPFSELDSVAVKLMIAAMTPKAETPAVIPRQTPSRRASSVQLILGSAA